ncbi:hypothetical protein ACFPYJ_20460 [Paenibacillus solisilvae]|uniref:Multi-tm2 domain protein n=1 Tax=Paenibacillus solisilvae TaxID=2486751 RepID=A0ABW0VZX9_9BACL
MNKNPLTAFLLSFIPGFGHLYLGRFIRAFVYAAGFWGPLALIALMEVSNGGSTDPDAILVLLIFAFIIGLLNMIDMLVTLLKPTSRYRGYPEAGASVPYAGDSGYTERFGPIDGTGGYPGAAPIHQQNERFYTIILSLIPGLSHFQLGLMQRGLTFIVGFFGLFAMIAFISFITHENGVFIFLLALPVIMFYGLFDAMQLLGRKQRGEEIPDRTIFEDFELNRETGRKSKTVALLLAVFPGAGHLYLGLQKRGLQLMAAFLLSIYLMDALRLSIFLYLIPILWFLSLFDAMQSVSKHGEGELKDVPLIDGLMNHQKWIGFGLIAIGAYYLFDSAILGMIEEKFPQWRLAYWFQRYVQVTVVSILLIIGGFRLMAGSKNKETRKEADPHQ